MLLANHLWRKHLTSMRTKFTYQTDNKMYNFIRSLRSDLIRNLSQSKSRDP